MNEVKLTKRGEFLYLDYTENGKRIRKSTGLKHTKANLAYALRNLVPDIEHKLKHRISTTENFKLSYFTDQVLKDTKERCKINTFLSYQAHVKIFFKIVGDRNVDEYSVRDIETFCNKAGGRAFSPRLAPISLAFDMAMRYELIARNPVKIAKKPNLKPKPKQAISQDDVKRLLENAQGELKTFLYFAFYTGARHGEILALRWCDIGQNSIYITRTKLKNGEFNSPKNGKAREIILLDPLRKYLASIKNKCDVFKANRLIFNRKSTMFSTYFKILQKELNIKPIQSLHATRHTFASMLMNAQIRPTLVQNLLGHSDLRMTSHYTHFMANETDKISIEKALKIS